MVWMATVHLAVLVCVRRLLTKAVVKILNKFTASCKSSSIVNLITCRRCGQHCVGEPKQPLHRRVNNHLYNIVHGKTEQSLVAEDFTGNGHTEVDTKMGSMSLEPAHDVY